MEEADVGLGEAVPRQVALPPQDALAPVQRGKQLVKGCGGGEAGGGRRGRRTRGPGRSRRALAALPSRARLDTWAHAVCLLARRPCDCTQTRPHTACVRRPPVLVHAACARRSLRPAEACAVHPPLSYASWLVAKPQRYTPLLICGYTHSLACAGAAAAGGARERRARTRELAAGCPPSMPAGHTAPPAPGAALPLAAAGRLESGGACCEGGQGPTSSLV